MNVGTVRDPYCWNCHEPGTRPLVTIGEAARLAGVSVESIYDWMESGRLDWVYHAGGQRRIYRDSIPDRAVKPVREPGESS